jgi:arylformamidase
MQMYDISLPVLPGMPVWPGDPPVELERFSDMACGDECNVSRLACSVHTGTHVDAPLHFFQHGASVEQLSLDVLIGPALVVECADVDAITAAYLDALAMPADTTRLLFKTRNSRLWSQPESSFRSDFVALTNDAAAWVVAHGIRLVGIDSLSIQLFHDSDSQTHQRLLEAGVVIVEGLNLCEIAQPGVYQFVCLPLKLVGSDGAPARAVLMELSSSFKDSS